ncbi:MAG: CpXC domain-containing protein [Pelolinea sp.]|nr:CpXC domain-containing protein [Pelolinea sp.]
MPKTQTSCPRCQQPVLVDVQQVFDMGNDPLAKQKILSNASNFLQCHSCGFQGMLPVPIIYHDPDKELLLTFFPPDLHTPVNEQEKQVGPLINKILNDLPQERRKAYLLQPKSMLTFQTMIEKILEADGITKEMLEDQQKKIKLLEKLIQTPKDDRLAIFEQEKETIDISFFSILSRIVESAMAQGDEKSQKPLLELQEQLFEHTKVGKELFSQAKETENAIKSLQEASKDGLTREKLLDLLENASSEAQFSTIASLARSGLDYAFFQLLSGKIDAISDGKEKQKLITLRENLLVITEEIDRQMQAQMKNAMELLEKIISSENIEEELEKNLNGVNDFFIQVLQIELSAARKDGNLEKIQKLKQIMIVIEKASASSEEMKLFEDILDYKDTNDLDRLISENSEKIDQNFLEMMNNIINQVQNQKNQPELIEKVNTVYKAVLKHSMKKQMKVN